MTTIRPFEPKAMRIGVLTAALQELTPRELRDRDPDRAVEDWLAFARELARRTLAVPGDLPLSEAVELLGRAGLKLPWSGK